MQYISVAEARKLSGLRLVLSTGSPGPWGISARALFTIRGVPFVPVRQEPMQANEDLVAWTGRRNAPVAVYNDEPPADGWLEILNLAERLGSGPSLLPEDPIDRALAVGFSAEICGAGGFGWSRRITMVAGGMAAPGSDADAMAKIAAGYGMREDALREAPGRIIGILQGLATQLRNQRDACSAYLVGTRLSACDVHWACFSLLVAPLPPEDCPMPEGLRAISAALPEALHEALDPILIAHRDRVWEQHIGLPLDYQEE